MSSTAFISYTRSSGTNCAARVQKLLSGHGIDVWQDRAHMIAGIDFWRQIEAAIERCSHLVMVVTPDAFEGDREILRREWYTARKTGKCVVPVMGAPGMRPNDERLPRWLPARHIYDLDVEAEKFVAHVATPCTIERIPFMVGDLPDNYVLRMREFDSLIENLLDDRHEAPVAIATALRGAGGFGKTTLAQAICHDDRIITAFKDGILWATLGEEAQTPDKVETKLRGLYAALTNERPHFVDRDDVANELAGKLQFKTCLIVIDDVWTFSELKPFLRGAGASARLITTRLAGIAAQSNAATVMVDEMLPEEADALLVAGPQPLPLDAATVRQLTKLLGEWPLLINLFAGHVRQVGIEGMPTKEAVSHLTRLLNEAGVTALDRANETDRSLAVKTTLEVSLARLSAAEIAALLDLAIFPEDQEIPVAVIGELWGLRSTASLERLRKFADLGLIKLAFATASIRIHDVIRLYLAGRHGCLADAHRRMADAWKDRLKLPHDHAWRWLAFHLSKGERIPELRLLLLDFAWLRAKLEATSVGALIADFDLLPADDPARLCQGALRLAANYLAGDKSQLAGQLASRLRTGVHPDLDSLIGSVARWRGAVWLRPLRPTLHAPGGPLVRVLRGYAGGHSGTIRSIAIDGIGRWAVSAGNSSPDGCLIIWNLATGTHRKIEDQAMRGGYTPLAMSHDGEFFISGFGSELRVWRTADGAQLETLPIEQGVVTAVVSATQRPRIVFGTNDGSVLRWDRDTREIKTLGRHADAVDAVAINAAGTWAASINQVDGRRWDLERNCHDGAWQTPGYRRINLAHCLRISENGKLVGWGALARGERLSDGREWFASLMSWDAECDRASVRASNANAEGFLCYSEEPARAIVLRRAREAGGRDGLALATLEPAPRLIDLGDVGRSVSTAVISSDGRWCWSADYEHDLFLWDLERALFPMFAPGNDAEWKSRKFDGFSADGCCAFFGLATDEALVFDCESESSVLDRNLSDAAIKTLHGARKATRTKKGARSLVVDNAVKRGHTSPIFESSVEPRGRWDATVAEDGTARVWDRVANRLIAIFSAETVFNGCTWSADGKTLAVTDYRGNTHLLRLEFPD